MKTESRSVTITDQELLDLSGHIYRVLIKKGTINEKDRDLFMEIATAFFFIFSDQYRELKEKTNG